MRCGEILGNIGVSRKIFKKESQLESQYGALLFYYFGRTFQLFFSTSLLLSRLTYRKRYLSIDFIRLLSDKLPSFVVANCLILRFLQR